MFRSIAALLGAALLLAGPAAVAQPAKPAPAVTADPAPAVPWCPPGQARDAAGRCVAVAAAPKLVGHQTLDARSAPVYVSTPAAKPDAAPIPPAPPVAAPTKAIAAAPLPAAKSQVSAAAPPAATPLMTIAAGEGDCATRAPNLIHDSRSPGGCAPCPRGRVPNLARQACVIPIPRRS